MLRRIFILAILLTLTACASHSVLVPYPQMAESYRTALALNQALSPVEDDCIEYGVLACVERARVDQLRGNIEASVESYAKALRYFDGQELEAVVQVSELFQASAALVVNDNVREYKGASYEKVYAHFEQGMNYWQLGELESAGVEFRKASQLQSQLSDKYAYELAETLQETQTELPEASWSEHTEYLEALAGELKSSFLNPYVFYVSALFWEATGELNSALVDYKKTQEIYPEYPEIKRDIERVEHKMGARNAYAKAPDSGAVWILLEQGLAPPMHEERISVFTGDNYVGVAVPSYRHASSLEGFRGKTELSWHDWRFNFVPMLDVLSLSSWHLHEQFPSIMLRQLLRAVSKASLQNLSHEKGGAGLAILASLYSMVTERADLRSWLTLPRQTSVLRLELPKGKQVLTMAASHGFKELVVDVEANRTRVLRLVEVGQHWYEQAFDLPL